MILESYSDEPLGKRAPALAGEKPIMASVLSETAARVAAKYSSILTEYQCLFVMGAPRSGTSWLHNMIAEHPCVFSKPGETTFFPNHVTPAEKAWSEEKQDLAEREWWSRGLPNKITETNYFEVLARFVHGFYQKLETDNGCTHYVEKAPENVHAVHTIKKYAPNARFIHIVRDGRNVAISMISAQRRLGLGAGNVLEGAQEWTQHVCAGREAGRYEGAYYEVKYESMLADGAAELKRIYDFCQLDYTDDLVNDIVAGHDFSNKSDGLETSGVTRIKGNIHEGWREKMTPMDRYLFDIVAGDLLMELGYAEPDWWCDSSLQWLRLKIQRRIAWEIISRVKRLFSRHL